MMKETPTMYTYMVELRDINKYFWIKEVVGSEAKSLFTCAQEHTNVAFVAKLLVHKKQKM